MSVSTVHPAFDVRPLTESRPPAVSWEPSPRWTVPPEQPALDFSEPDAVNLARPRPGVRATVVRARWTARPRPGLPDAAEWSATLVVALFQALLGQRPIAQLNRWLADDVLSAVIRRSRQRRSTPSRSVLRVALCSVRVQHPSPETAEVAARIAVGGTMTALALRLEALGERWHCSALELDPRALR
jgi:hypothetical protein